MNQVPSSESKRLWLCWREGFCSQQWLWRAKGSAPVAAGWARRERAAQNGSGTKPELLSHGQPRGWNLHCCTHTGKIQMSLYTQRYLLLSTFYLSCGEGHEQASHFAHYQGFKDCCFSAHISFPVFIVFNLFGQSRCWIHIKYFHYLFICSFAVFWGVAQHPMDIRTMNNTAFDHESKCCTLSLRTPLLLP